MTAITVVLIIALIIWNYVARSFGLAHIVSIYIGIYALLIYFIIKF